MTSLVENGDGWRICAWRYIEIELHLPTVVPCLELELTDFLLASTREHYPGVQIHFTCENDLYHMSGPNYLTCRNGSWSDRLPSCTER